MVGAERFENVGMPDLLDTERPPCFASWRQRGGHDIAGGGYVETNALLAAVPQVSMRLGSSGTGTRVANSPSLLQAAAISPMVSFLTRRRRVYAAISVGGTSPVMIYASAQASPRGRSPELDDPRERVLWCHRSSPSTKPQQVMTFFGQDRLRGTARLRPPALVAHAMISRLRSTR